MWCKQKPAVDFKTRRPHRFTDWWNVFGCVWTMMLRVSEFSCMSATARLVRTGAIMTGLLSYIIAGGKCLRFQDQISGGITASHCEYGKLSQKFLLRFFPGEVRMEGPETLQLTTPSCWQCSWLQVHAFVCTWYVVGCTGNNQKLTQTTSLPNLSTLWIPSLSRN